MSFQAMALVINLRLSANEKFVLLMLANYADESGKCWPSIGRLAEDTGLSESTVRRSLYNLRDYSGLIALQKRVDGDGRQTSHNFLIDMALCARLAMKGEGVRVTPPLVTEEGGGCQGDREEGVRVTPEPIIRNLSEEPKPHRAAAPHHATRSESSAFASFWQAYPATKRRVARKTCYEVWSRGGLDNHADEILEHVGAMSATEQWKTGYEPAPLTYLRQRRWEDGLPAEQKRRFVVAL